MQRGKKLASDLTFRLLDFEFCFSDPEEYWVLIKSVADQKYQLFLFNGFIFNIGLKQEFCRTKTTTSSSFG